MTMEKKEYIGDAVYVVFDGYGIWLLANDSEYPTDRVYLEPNVLDSLNNFYKKCTNEKG